MTRNAVNTCSTWYDVCGHQWHVSCRRSIVIAVNIHNTEHSHQYYSHVHEMWTGHHLMYDTDKTQRRLN